MSSRERAIELLEHFLLDERIPGDPRILIKELVDSLIEAAPQGGAAPGEK